MFYENGLHLYLFVWFYIIYCSQKSFVNSLPLPDSQGDGGIEVLLPKILCERQLTKCFMTVSAVSLSVICPLIG